MVPEDVGRTRSGNVETTNVIDRYDHSKPAIIVARQRPRPSSAPALRRRSLHGFSRSLPSAVASSACICRRPFLLPPA
jgi:hypothetical protein